MADPRPPWTLFFAIVAVILIVAGGASAFVYYHDRPTGATQPRALQVGDNATVNYIGFLGSGPETGRVFDTSIFSVAHDNATYLKSLKFGLRPADQYKPLPVHVGVVATSTGSYSLGGVNYTQVVTGFWQGLVGLGGNQTRVVSFPPSLGYGPTNPACVATWPLTQTFPIVQTLPGNRFQKLYPGAVAATGSEFADPHYGWTVVVLSANSSFVTVENLPYLGETAKPAGWTVVVTNITSTPNGTGQITVVNQLAPAQAGHLLGKDFLGTGPCTSQVGGVFIVSSVDPGRGVYTADFSPQGELQGQTLIFVVTVIDIFPPIPVAV